MNRRFLQILAIAGLIGGAATIASASPATPILGHDPGVRTSPIENVDYYWNHRRYKHRSWDKRHRRWRYY